MCHHIYLHSDHSSWFEAIRSVSIQREKLRVGIIREAFTLRHRQEDRQVNRQVLISFTEST